MAETVAPHPESWLSHFRLTDFRAGQKEVVTAVLEGRDCLCIMPTGGGKSLCYQLPAVMRPGVVLVISPLIALMKDQVDGLQGLGLRATYVNSSLDGFEQNQRLNAMAAGQYDLVYIAPERLRSQRFLESLKSITVQLLAVDEAHCISEWGHDFRPDYARLGQFRERLGSPQTIALTATATPLVRNDVVQQLRLREPEVFITGFARPNLRFEVHHPASNREKDELLLQLLNETPGPGIIYASTRKRCESIVDYLTQRRRHPVGLYHAGLLPDDRRSVQDRFMSGQVPLIVATNAFGMGIDKRDLRLVVHYNMPGSLEAYYQESGRAGRDGLPSRCALLFSYADRYIQEFFIENTYPSRDIVQRVYEFLRSQPGDPVELTQQEIRDALDLSLSGEGIGVCERLLEKCGVLERLDAKQNMAQVKLDSDLPTLVDMLPREARLQRRVLRQLEEEVDDRRREWVSFHPAKVAAALDMDRDALYRALRELTRLTVFDYVPPFRGRAIHMVRRDVPFAQLEIDFDELQRRKLAEFEKLERVITYAQAQSCRQREILRYFGDAQAFRCERCDNCQPLAASVLVVPTAAGDADPRVLEAVRIVLSGVARTRSRVGRNLLAKMLCGSQSAQISQLQLDRLSTFGLLRDLRQPDVVDLIQALIEAGLVHQNEKQRRRPVVQLTERGASVMRAECELPGLRLSPSLRLRLQSRQLLQPSPPSQVGKPVEAESDADLVPGDSPPVALSEAAVSAGGGEDSPQASGEADAVRSEIRPDYYWTWRLLADGYDWNECLAIRQFDRDTLLGHLLAAVEGGLAVELDWILTEGQQALLATLVGKDALGSLASLQDRLPMGIELGQVRLFWRLRGELPNPCRPNQFSPPAP